MEENPAIALFFALAVIIAAARVAGAIARRFDQPRVLGELIVGVILGPTLIDLLHASIFGLEAAHLESTVIELAELGVLLLMFKVGLDVHISELVKVGRVGVLAGVLGALLPVLIGFGMASLANYQWQPSLFAGVTLAATSVSISAQVLLELGFLHTKEGSALLATALIDDVVAIIMVSLVIAVTMPQEAVQVGDLVLIIVRMTVYIVVAFLIAWFILPVFINWLDQRPESKQSFGNAAVALIIALVFGWSAEYLGGVATITGAFIAGVGLSRVRPSAKREIDVAVENISYAFLVPIFFVSVGLQTDLSTFPLQALPFAAGLLIAATLTKIIGCGIGAKLGGFNNAESLRLGVCMISRGEVGLIIASLGLSSGIFTQDDPMFASLFLVILVTTLITPPLVRRVFPAEPVTEVETEHA